MSSPLATDCPQTAFDALAAPERRYVLSILSERSSPMSVESLATEVAVDTHQSPIVTDVQSETAAADLVHRHLPRLCEAGIVAEVTGSGDGANSNDDDSNSDDSNSDDSDRDTRRFALADHPMLEADWVRTLLERPDGGPTCDEELLERTLDVLRPDRRRTVLRLLARRLDGLAVADLAALYVAETASDCRLVDVSADDRKPVEIRLVHDVLPALADVGLVDYDRSAATVSIATDAPQWGFDWLAAGPLADVVRGIESRPGADSHSGPGPDSTAVDATTDAGSCWTVAGRESVVARGHEIADSAREELFVTVPDAGLMQNRCLERWRAAADRGVEIYVGSRSQEVRDIVRQTIPEATICEPQFDWLNFPVDGIHHGRVVFADRERVMLVTIDDTDTDGESRATAITGDGVRSTLVTLVREHVGPRLDRLESRRADDEFDGGRSSPLPM